MGTATRRRAVAAAVLSLAGLLLAASWSVAAPTVPLGDRALVDPPSGDAPPDIVLILMDDFSMDLLGTMRHATAMSQEGAFYRNAFVVDSLCCPSRASIFTGRPPHLTGVLTNGAESRTEPLGGFAAFRAHGNGQKSFNVALHAAGYTTGFVGKYLNGYDVVRRQGELRAPPSMPGWSEFAAFMKGAYDEWGFLSTQLDPSGELSLQNHGRPRPTDPTIDRAYATNVAARKAVDFIRRHRDDTEPYFLEVATYAPHSQTEPAYPGQPLFPSAMADRAPAGRPNSGGNCGLRACGDLRLTDLAGYDDPRDDNAPTYLLADGSTQPAPPWRTNPITLTADQALLHYRNRARMVQSVDRLVARVREAVGPDTYVLLTSDNGLHLGQHQINWGKGTPYDSDTRVPLLVVGPDVVPGDRDQWVSNIDLAPTIEEIAGLVPEDWRAGVSFAPSLTQRDDAEGRYVYVEHTNLRPLVGLRDPDDRAGATMAMIPSYVAVRGSAGLLVRVDLDRAWATTRFAWELYRYDVPWEDVNVFATDHDAPWAQDLMDHLLAWLHCTPAECRADRR